MIIAATAAILAPVMRWVIALRTKIPGPARVHAAATVRVPGLIITSVRSEIFDQQSAWEVRGTDQEGTVWLIDVKDSGEVILAEAIAYGPPPSVAEPVADF